MLVLAVGIAVQRSLDPSDKKVDAFTFRFPRAAPISPMRIPLSAHQCSTTVQRSSDQISAARVVLQWISACGTAHSDCRRTRRFHLEQARVLQLVLCWPQPGQEAQQLGDGVGS
jgi:hypothetical protein